MRSVGSVVQVLENDHWDLGSIPRSTQTLFHIFSNIFMCSAFHVFHHKPPMVQAPSVHNPQSNGQRMKTMVLRSQRVPGQSQKSTRALGLMGWNLQLTPPMGPTHPPGFVTFFFIFFYS